MVCYKNKVVYILKLRQSSYIYSSYFSNNLVKNFLLRKLKYVYNFKNKKNLVHIMNFIFW